jgi:hypothetical protein
MSALDILRPEVRDGAERLRAEFLSAQPFRHVVVDNFLTADACRQAIADFPSFEDKHAINEYGEVGGKAVREKLSELGPIYAKLDALFRSPDFRRWVGRVSDIDDLLFDPDYVGGGTHENIDHQELDAHVDFNFHPKTRLHRRLNLILFLNAKWGEDWGGQLQLHRDPWSPPAEDDIRSVTPVANRCVLFETTETSWHGFPPIRIPADKKGVTRRSVAVYYYTRTRPAEQTGPEHSTYYVPRPLPEQIRPGRTLTEEDYSQIRHLLDRRDRQVRFLWEKEREFRGFLAQVENSVAFRLSRAMLWPLRAVRDVLKGGADR